jgi:hypothetical protein
MNRMILCNNSFQKNAVKSRDKSKKTEKTSKTQMIEASELVLKVNFFIANKNPLALQP